MVKARLGKEIVVKVTNEIGVLNQMCKLVAEKGANILAVHGTVEGETAVLRLVTTDNLRIKEALAAKNFGPHESDCVLVEMPHKPGILKVITEKLAAEGIDIHHLYATAGETTENCVVVFLCSNNDRALVVLSK